MSLDDLSLGDLYLGWTLLFEIVFGVAALLRAPNDLGSIAQYVAVATGTAAFAAALFAVPMWSVMRVAG